MGFFDKLKKITTNLFSGFSEADEAFFEELEETLILADLGMDTALDAVEKLRTRVRKEKLQDQEAVKAALRDILAEEMDVGGTELDLSTRPAVVLFIGVNGVGKTTSIGKLGYQLKSEGKRVLFCAADTFRAAAADQLQIWAERAGCELVRQHEGADPGAVLFDALQAAKARGVDVVLCDTAGRLHNKANLMAELAKLSKIIDRECPGAARETLLCGVLRQGVLKAQKTALGAVLFLPGHIDPGGGVIPHQDHRKARPPVQGLRYLCRLRLDLGRQRLAVNACCHQSLPLPRFGSPAAGGAPAPPVRQGHSLPLPPWKYPPLPSPRRLPPPPDSPATHPASAF